MPEKMLDRMSERMPDRMSGRMLEYIYAIYIYLLYIYIYGVHMDFQMVCQKQRENSVSEWGSLQESSVFV